MPQVVGKNKYEKCIWGVIHNSAFKLLSALELYKSGYQNESFFLTVIAEEELSKLTMIPIANEIRELNNLFEDRKKNKSPYFNHRKKQKLFSSFGMSGKKYEEIEEIKQSCLYIGLGKNEYPEFIKIQKKDLEDELIHAISLFIYDIHRITSAPSLSNHLKKIMHGFYLNNLIIGGVKSLAPNIGKAVDKNIKENAEDLRSQDPLIRDATTFSSNIFFVIDWFKRKHKKDYKEHLKNLYGLSFIEIAEYIANLNKK